MTVMRYHKACCTQHSMASHELFLLHMKPSFGCIQHQSLRPAGYSRVRAGEGVGGEKQNPYNIAPTA